MIPMLRSVPAPASDLRWTQGFALIPPRGGHDAAELGGAVYVAGGYPDNSFSSVLQDLQRLDSPGGRWRRPGRLR
jgi:Kelch motif